MVSKQYYVYIMTNKYDTVFYTGITNNLIIRVYQHKNKFVKGFTEKYNIIKLVYYEAYNDVNQAITREKQIKNYRREKKLKLIVSINPYLKDIELT